MALPLAADACLVASSFEADADDADDAAELADDAAAVFEDSYSEAIFLIPICISFDTAEKRRYATYLILNRRFSFAF
ncbi:TPA: hypothetical protein PPI13_005443 [Escherichia coli]|nr:hypothetical protein [Escherichia coli]